MKGVWVAACLMLSLCLFQPRAQALDKNVRTVLVSGLYGAAAGTALGLVTYPFNHRLKTVFIGTSVGLYIGILMGFYLSLIHI